MQYCFCNEKGYYFLFDSSQATKKPCLPKVYSLTSLGLLNYTDDY